MGWAVGWDSHHERDIGYGVPSFCEHPECTVEIDRGLAHRCGGIDAPREGDGCGLYFCAEHSVLAAGGVRCARCDAGEPPFDVKPDHPAWVQHKETDPSWAEWREERDRG